MKVRKKMANTYDPWAVGIDPSLTGFGLAFWHPSASNAPVLRFSSKLRGVERLIDIRDWVSHTLRGQVGVISSGFVCMEGYAPGAKYRREDMGELCGIVKTMLYETFAEVPMIVPPTKLKKFVTGNGNAKKDQMMMAVYKKWHYEAPTNDQADAYALARVAACVLGTDQPRFDYEKVVVDGLKAMIITA